MLVKCRETPSKLLIYNRKGTRSNMLVTSSTLTLKLKTNSLIKVCRLFKTKIVLSSAIFLKQKKTFNTCLYKGQTPLQIWKMKKTILYQATVSIERSQHLLLLSFLLSKEQIVVMYKQLTLLIFQMEDGSALSVKTITSVDE